jgi:hypothetical protein
MVNCHQHKITEFSIDLGDNATNEWMCGKTECSGHYANSFPLRIDWSSRSGKNLLQREIHPSKPTQIARSGGLNETIFAARAAMMPSGNSLARSQL